ncbi:hypothetical protein [Paenibacillus agricola]|uniref:PH (Pleckstrin Homology) domain-containing protein n=1 Tax=Paenibacillus agricola TaxID=2716264 RepID=A0ABX0J9T2_9BACL|nr:hypothetical protein [Paenibacillus agricola]NHN30746.1 hypothetical protein [Paenibacillus agricola]
MSRKWERMVKKNTKTINKTRVKQGKETISQATSADGAITLKGRNWTLSLLLFCVGIFCFITFRGTSQEDNLYWITGGSYILLSIFMYFVRRPHLKIGKDYLGTRRFTGDKRMKAEEIKDIAISKDTVSISFTSNKGKWAFTRFYHRMNIAEISEKLKEFAENNAVTLKMEK